MGDMGICRLHGIERTDHNEKELLEGTIRKTTYVNLSDFFLGNEKKDKSVGEFCS
jgi:hypothetical protein